MTVLGELCCVALPFCCVVLLCLVFLSISWMIKVMYNKIYVRTPGMCVSFLQVHSEAFKASTAFIAHLDSAPMRKKFVDMIPLMLAVSTTSTYAGQAHYDIFRS